MVTRPLLFIAVASMLAACAPELDDHPALVSSAEILAIASSPAEATPEDTVSFSALYVDQSGIRPGNAMDWAFCIDRKPLTDEGTVSPTCLTPSGDALVPIGSGLDASGVLPEDGCRLFGPDPPDAVNGQPAGRPVDPDPSGGFYQPVRVHSKDGAGFYAIGATRIECGALGVTQDQGAEFARRYRANDNPAILKLVATRASGTSTTLVPGATAADLTVSQNEAIALDVSWAACPTAPLCGDGICGIDEDPAACVADCKTPLGCAGSEQYLAFDPSALVLTTRREAINVTWFATAGAMLSDRTGRTEDEADITDTTNTWTAPAGDADVDIWIVIRDDRGGVGWQSYRFHVGARAN